MSKSDTNAIQTSMQFTDEIHLHKTGWVLQRIGWVAMFIFVTVAAMGLFGNGLLSRTTLSAGMTRVEYERFARQGSAFHLHIQSGSSNGLTTVSIPADYLREMKVTTIQPTPETEHTEDGYNIYAFKSADEAVISFFLEPQKPGALRAQLKVNDTLFALTQYIYP